MSDSNVAVATPETTKAGKGVGALLKEVQNTTDAPDKAAPGTPSGNGKGKKSKGGNKAPKKPAATPATPAATAPTPAVMVPMLDPFNLPEPERRKVLRKDITLDKRLQHRKDLQDTREGGAVDQYAELYKEGNDLGEITLVEDVSDTKDKGKLWCTDGFQRTGAAEKAKLSEMNAKIYKGNYLDALMLSCRANSENSVLPRTEDDKKRSVFAVMDNPVLLQAAFAAGEGTGGIHRSLKRICGVALGTVDAAFKARNVKPKGGQLIPLPKKRTPAEPPKPPTSPLAGMGGSVPTTEVSPAEQRKADIDAFEAMVQREDGFLIGKSVQFVKQMSGVLAKYVTSDEHSTAVREIMAKYGFPLDSEFDKEAAREGKSFSPYHAMLEHWKTAPALCEMFLAIGRHLEDERAKAEAAKRPHDKVAAAAQAATTPTEASPSTDAVK